MSLQSLASTSPSSNISTSHDSAMTSTTLATSVGTTSNDRRPHHFQQRGRSVEKIPRSKDELVCVVALLIQEQHVSEKEAIKKIQEVRRKYDQAYARWEPHLTLIPPFLIPFDSTSPNELATATTSTHTSSSSSATPMGEGSPENNELSEVLQELSAKIQAVCDSQQRHSLCLDETNHFALRRYHSIHLRPSASTDSSAFLQLQQELEAALPETIDNARSKKNQAQQQQQRVAFKPHLTLGQSTNEPIKEKIYHLAARILGTEKHSLQVKVEKLQLMIKPVNRSGPYEVYREFHLKSEKDAP
jgi:2'-5' RNA ligase